MASYSSYQNNKRKNANSHDLTKRMQDSDREKENTLSKEGIEERFVEWVTFYRRNIHRFVIHYFGMTNLNLFQLLWLYLMNICTTICIVACRGIGKSYLIAVYACARSVLYPNSKIVIASATKKQAGLIVTEKIQKELMPNYPNLAREIKQIKTNANDIEVMFHNGSSIVVVPASENARGYRASCMIYEEFRMIKKEIIDSVLQPFLFVRPAPYINNDKYKHLAEEPMEIYISSAWIKQHWMWDTMKQFTKSMLKKGDTYLIGFDYCLALRHNLKTFKQMRQAKKKSDSMTFAMEYENIQIGENEQAFYTFELLNSVRNLKKAFYLRKDLDVIGNKKNKSVLAKQKGEIRIVSVDISMISGSANDNTVITCVRGLPVRDGYERQVCYMQAINGGNTTEQSLQIKRAFYDFEADYIILDTQSSGINVFDEMGKILYDDKRDCEYPAWTCFNDEETRNRIKNQDALEVVFSFKGNASLNHEMHYSMKNTLEKRKIKLLINSTESKDYLDTLKDYTSSSIDEQLIFELPYLETDLLINEMVNLTYEINKTTNKLKLTEPRNGRKDRYISLAMSNYLIQLLERDIEEEKEVEAKAFCFI